MNKRLSYISLSALVCSSLLVMSPGADAAPSNTKTKCHMKFDLKSWSVFYKSGKGHGLITCDNGQTAAVKIRSVGGGVSFGKNVIRNGHGSFTRVNDITDLYGGYAVSEAHAGVHASAGSQALWNGHIGLTLTGTGKGWDLGFAFGKLKIEPDLADADNISQEKLSKKAEPKTEPDQGIEEDLYYPLD